MIRVKINVIHILLLLLTNLLFVTKAFSADTFQQKVKTFLETEEAIKLKTAFESFENYNNFVKDENNIAAIDKFLKDNISHKDTELYKKLKKTFSGIARYKSIAKTLENCATANKEGNAFIEKNVEQILKVSFLENQNPCNNYGGSVDSFESIQKYMDDVQSITDQLDPTKNTENLADKRKEAYQNFNKEVFIKSFENNLNNIVYNIFHFDSGFTSDDKITSNIDKLAAELTPHIPAGIDIKATLTSKFSKLKSKNPTNTSKEKLIASFESLNNLGRDISRAFEQEKELKEEKRLQSKLASKAYTNGFNKILADGYSHILQTFEFDEIRRSLRNGTFNKEHLTDELISNGLERIKIMGITRLKKLSEINKSLLPSDSNPYDENKQKENITYLINNNMQSVSEHLLSHPYHASLVCDQLKTITQSLVPESTPYLMGTAWGDTYLSPNGTIITNFGSGNSNLFLTRDSAIGNEKLLRFNLYELLTNEDSPHNIFRLSSELPESPGTVIDVTETKVDQTEKGVTDGSTDSGNTENGGSEEINKDDHNFSIKVTINSKKLEENTPIYKTFNVSAEIEGSDGKTPEVVKAKDLKGTFKFECVEKSSSDDDEDDDNDDDDDDDKEEIERLCEEHSGIKQKKKVPFSVSASEKSYQIKVSFSSDQFNIKPKKRAIRFGTACNPFVERNCTFPDLEENQREVPFYLGPPSMMPQPPQPPFLPPATGNFIIPGTSF